MRVSIASESALFTLGMTNITVGSGGRPDKDWQPPYMDLYQEKESYGRWKISYILDYVEEDKVHVRVGTSTYVFRMEPGTSIRLPEDWQQGVLKKGKRRVRWPTLQVKIHRE